MYDVDLLNAFRFFMRGMDMARGYGVFEHVLLGAFSSGALKFKDGVLISVQ